MIPYGIPRIASIWERENNLPRHLALVEID